eukprot:Colp12_sorted_trinity150504_noHs@2646
MDLEPARYFRNMKKSSKTFTGANVERRIAVEEKNAVNLRHLVDDKKAKIISDWMADDARCRGVAIRRSKLAIQEEINYANKELLVRRRKALREQIETEMKMFDNELFLRNLALLKEREL